MGKEDRESAADIAQGLKCSSLAIDLFKFKSVKSPL